MVDQNPDKVASYWDEHVGEHLESFDNWESNLAVRRHQNQKISGDPSLTALEWFWRKYGPFNEMASIGSGTGLLECHIATLKEPSARIVGYDISPRSVEIASANGKTFQNVVFEVADVNSKIWQQGQLDAAFAHGALHHVERLDHCLGQMRRALRPNGLLFVNDYVGPSRFQWSDMQMRLANELVATVPPQWVRRNEVIRYPVETIQNMDNSEAVNSQFIEDAVRAHFRIIERIARGGTLLMPIFGAGCLDPEILKSPAGLRCLTDLAEAEDRMITDGQIPPNNVVIIARPR